MFVKEDTTGEKRNGIVLNLPNWVETPAKFKIDIRIATELTLCKLKLYCIFLS